MSVLPLVNEKDPILKTKLNDFDFNVGDAEKISIDLIDSMLYYNGIGLAANQVGINARVFSMIHENQNIVLFNPELISVSDEKIKMEEGCLSFTGLYPKIVRPYGVSIKYFDKNNKPMMANFIKLSARVVLHEYDHLNGYTFHDRASKYDMSNAKRKRIGFLRKNKKSKRKDL